MKCYTKIITWSQNIFKVPWGRVGEAFISELGRIISLFSNDSALSHIAINAVIVMLPLLLQKPSKKSKTSDHTKYLEKRLALWKVSFLTY